METAGTHPDSDSDRERWNARYRAADGTPGAPSRHLLAFDDRLPESGRALDVAGGTGRHAIWLAQRGLDVTLVDVSDVALDLAADRACRVGVELRTVHLDLTVDPLPPGPWALIVCSYYLQRDLWPALRGSLAPGGWVALVLPTTRNLERHRRPRARFLLEPGEAADLVEGLQVVHHEEGWLDGEHHEAVVLARRPAAPSASPDRRLRPG